jgi:hypothetical protein
MTWRPRGRWSWAIRPHCGDRGRGRAGVRTGRTAGPAPRRPRWTCGPRWTRRTPSGRPWSRNWPGCARRWTAPAPRRPRGWSRSRPRSASRRPPSSAGPPRPPSSGAWSRRALGAAEAQRLRERPRRGRVAPVRRPARAGGRRAAARRRHRRARSTTSPTRRSADAAAEALEEARSAEVDARLALRTAEERARAIAGRADSLRRQAASERQARARAAARGRSGSAGPRWPRSS